MKVLVLTSTFPRWKNDTEPAFVYELSRRLAQTLEIDVLAPHTAGANRHDEWEGMQIYRYRYAPNVLEKLAYNGGILPNLKKNPFLTLLIPFFLLAQMIAAYRLCRDKEYDVIHAHWIIPQGICIAILKRVLPAKTKILITSHGGDLFSLRHSWLGKVKTWAIRQANHLTVVSSAMKSEAIRLGIPENKISVAPMGVDLTGTFTPPKDGTKRSGIIFVGRLVEKKGVAILLDAFKIALYESPSLKLKIIGDGPLKKDLIQHAMRNGISSKVEFLGPVPNKLIPIHLRRAKVAVIPSIVTKSGDQEGLGLTIIEALGCGCAVIASDLPATSQFQNISELLTLIQPNNHTALANAIIQALKDRIMTPSDGIAIEAYDWECRAKTYDTILSNEPPFNF